MRLRLIAGILSLAVLFAVAPAAPTAHAAAGPVVFKAYDANGARLSWAAFRKLQHNGKGSVGVNDMLVDPTTLAVVKGWPLYRNGQGDPQLDHPGTPVALAMAWPTSDGYSNLILDLPGPGTYNFTVLAATQAVRELDAARAARPDYAPSGAFSAASQRAHTERDAAVAAGASESARGGAGARSYDAAVAAMNLLLQEYGVQYARANRAAFRPPFGVTFDDISGGQAHLRTVQDLAGTDGSVRIVMDKARPASYYKAEVDAAHARGLKVVGEILDSSDMAGVSMTQWQNRVRSYVDTLATVDAWEIGNEVNGNWLGTGVPSKVAWAADYANNRSAARVLLTLYWQLGEDTAKSSMFNWALTHLTADVLADIDDIGLSMYVEDHPMGGLTFDRVVRTLHAAFPSERIAVTELGYWSADLGHTWWWGSQSDPTGAARQAVAKLYQSAVFGYPYSGGGAYWWYYLEEALPTSTPLWQTLAGVHRAMTG